MRYWTPYLLSGPCLLSGLFVIGCFRPEPLVPDAHEAALPAHAETAEGPREVHDLAAHADRLPDFAAERLGVLKDKPATDEDTSAEDSDGDGEFGDEGAGDDYDGSFAASGDDFSYEDTPSETDDEGYDGDPGMYEERRDPFEGYEGYFDLPELDPGLDQRAD